VRLVDRFSGNPFTTFTSDYELLMEEIPSFLEEEDNLNVLVDSISLRELTAPASLTGSGGVRRSPKLLVLTSMDFRRETFFVKSEGIARIIGRICQKLTDPRSASQLVASCGRSYPSSPTLMASPSSSLLTSSPSPALHLKRTLFEQLNSSQGEGSWVRYPTSEVCNTNNNLYSAEVIFPSKVTKEIVSGVAQTFYRQLFPQPSSYNPKNGTVLWRVSNLGWWTMTNLPFSSSSISLVSCCFSLPLSNI
jgi:hypothetical protein